MGITLTEKILQEHLVSGKLTKSEERVFRVDSTLVHDLSGLLTFLGFNAMHPRPTNVPLPLIFNDHNLVSMESSNLDDQNFLHSCARKFGLCYSKPGNGISHSIYYHRLGKPGTFLIGADSHTATAGALGMLGIGVGGLDVSLVLSGLPFRMKVPAVLEIRLEGRLPEGTCAKDASLMLLKQLSVKGCVGKIVEYTGCGVKTLTVPQRATLANMGVEMGATSSIFPSDEQTRRFFISQNRESDYRALFPDHDAYYEDSITFDLSSVVPMVALPGQPDYGCAVNETEKVAFSQIFIGGCTNGSYVDLARAALVLKGKKVSPNTHVLVSCGTHQIYNMLLHEGYLQMFVDAGVRILENSCGPCMGIGQVPASGAVVLRTTNRNYKGRSGTPDAKIYLSGTETAAASSITGYLTTADQVMDISILNDIKEPETYLVDDSMLVHYEYQPQQIALEYSNNIRPMPINDPLETNISCKVSIKLGDGVSTDDIVISEPHILTLRLNIPELSKYIFHNIDPEFPSRAVRMGKSVIIAGDGYAHGSSREHAAIGCMYLGVSTVIVKSMDRIHRANLINFGVLPLLFGNDKDYDCIELEDVLIIENVVRQLRESNSIQVRNETQNYSFKIISDLSSSEIDILEAGGLIPYFSINGYEGKAQYE